MANIETNDELDVGVLYVAHDGTVEHVNDAAQKRFHIQPTEHTHLFDLFTDSAIQSKLHQCLQAELDHFTMDVEAEQCLFLCQRLQNEKSPQIVLIVLPLALAKSEQPDQVDAHLLKTIGQMSAGIAHEVRNPLTSVKGFLQLLNQEFDEKYLDIAQSELDRAVDTLNDLLSVSKPDVSEEPFTPINLAGEIESLLLLFQNQLYDIQVVKNISAVNDTIEGPRQKLKKALFNLVKNAIEAMPDGGTLTLTHQREHDGIRVSVTDTGEGIPKEKLSMLGTPFFSMKQGGTGMGLTQVYATMKEMEAKIKVNSTEGKGTSFELFFPFAQKEKHDANDRRRDDMLYKKINGEQRLAKHIRYNAEQYADIWFQQIEDHKEYSDDLKEDEKALKQEYTTLFKLIADNIEHEERYHILKWAEKEGSTRAKLDFSITMMLELFHIVRETVWKAIEQFYIEVEKPLNDSEYFSLERKVNDVLDLTVQHFSSHYVKYKNELLHTHRQMVDELSVPVIPLTNEVCVLPLVGHIDTFRAQKIREKTLYRVKELKAERLILDISGVPYIDTSVVSHMFKIVKGLKLLGCKSILTGISAEIAETMIELGVEIGEEVQTSSDLQKALKEINVI